MSPLRIASIAFLAAFALLFSTAAPAQEGAPVEGRDYQLIDNGQTFANHKQKIEVAEVFGYWCHHCRNFQPLVDTWKATLPADVDFVYVPATFNPNDPFARAYFAAQQLKIAERAHLALFRAIHDERSFPANASAEELAAFYANYGVAAEQFLAAMNSPEVASQMRWARKFIENAKVQGTPMLIVGGKYRVLGRSHADAIRIAGQLVAQLRAQRR
ncbi:thiol:disulfide interchange protein DsbA/DsbL [Lysobacter pythonis]|uniref:Thiol:disulfide interchange protein n=1 Tax=Solilutibacter pythonis TaxID=2483112 RepID=A0A3M2HIZ9_9GAMM|nr:thiol:disulfide interchange protein DsbA/DsbL [Lysobacter pythonis]RMH87550.1 thiol:disulfide interchange protein DsbA/DsbL [Lysobacter pythonis]